MRLDIALVERGLARSRNQAAAVIRRGDVRVNGEVETRRSRDIDDADVVNCQAERYVSRAAHKLISALDESGLNVPERVLDAGASTGGFTQVLLERGAARVYAVDVGHHQMAPEVRDDPRVFVREGLNLKDLTLDDLEGEPVDLLCCDVSFISLRRLLAPMFAVLSERGAALLMIKPQFEVGKGRLGSGGIVPDGPVRQAAIQTVVEDAQRLGGQVMWRADSRVPGAGGNVEHFCLLSLGSLS